MPAVFGYNSNVVDTYNSNAVLTVTNKALTSNTAVLTVGTHTLTVGDSFTVAGVGAPFDGRQTVSAADATTVSFKKTAANVVSAAVSSASAKVTPEKDPVAGTTDSVGWTCQQVKRDLVTNGKRNGVAADTVGTEYDVATGGAAG